MRSHRFRVVDLLVCVVLVLILGPLVIAARDDAQENDNRIRCASNLRMIGQAMLLYANENRGAYPRTVRDPKDEHPTPTWGTPYAARRDLGPVEGAHSFPQKGSDLGEYVPRPHDVTAALFLLLRTQDISSDVFICPSTGREAWNFDAELTGALEWTNWPGNRGLARHLSYSYQNPYPSAAAIKDGWKLNSAISAEYATAADMNPGSDSLHQISIHSKAEEQRLGNSPNHGRDGQNVLYGDGHVEFQANPFVGINRDNIYTFGPSGANYADTPGDGIIGPSMLAQDSILLPPAADIAAADRFGDLRDPPPALPDDDD